MITREEALQMTHNCRITSLGELAHGYVIYQVASKEIINQIFDELEQHIKSLEAQLDLSLCNNKRLESELTDALEVQLDNTEQITCEYKEDNDIYMGTVYNFNCGYSYVTIEGDLKENGVNYCPSCGGKITQKDTK